MPVREITTVNRRGTGGRGHDATAGVGASVGADGDQPAAVRARPRVKPMRVVKYTVLTLLVVIVVYPLVWVAISALRSGAALVLHPFSLPSSFNWSNYSTVLITNGFDINILNSLWICVLSTVVVTVLTAMAAYPLSRMQWKLRRVVVGYFGVGLIVPVYAALIPLYIMLRGVERAVGPQLALAIVYLAVGMPVSTIILISYMSKVPADIEEAAVMDGCSLFGVLWRVILPVTGPGIGVSATFAFIVMWNELLFALVFLNAANQLTIPVALQQYVAQYATDWPAELAAVTLALVPTLIIYLILQRRLMAGVLAAGGMN